MNDQDHLTEIERVDQGAEPPNVVVEGVRPRRARLVREPEADQVGHDHAQRLSHELSGDLAVEKPPGGVTMDAQHRLAASGLHHVELVAVGQGGVALERQRAGNELGQGRGREAEHEP